MTASIRYGMWDLRGLYQKYASIALVFAVILHFLIIRGYYLDQYLSKDEDQIGMVGTLTYLQLGPPPSINNTEAAPQVAVSVPIAKPTIGIPVPVPDAEVSPDATIASQIDLQQVQGPATGTGDATGGVQVQQD